MIEHNEQQMELTQEEKEWRKAINKKRIILLILFVSYVPLGAVIHTITKSDTLTIPVVIIHLLAIGYFIVTTNASRCPRCHNFFFFT